MFFKLLNNKFSRYPVIFKNLSYIISVTQNPNLLLMIKNDLSIKATSVLLLLKIQSLSHKPPVEVHCSKIFPLFKQFHCVIQNLNISFKFAQKTPVKYDYV